MTSSVIFDLATRNLLIELFLEVLTGFRYIHTVNEMDEIDRKFNKHYKTREYSNFAKYNSKTKDVVTNIILSSYSLAF